MTGIEWVLNPDGTRGITANSKTGCLNGCSYCYARKLANGRLKGRYLGNANYSVYWPGDKLKARDDPFYPRWWPERLDKIRAIKKPTGIFLDDMSDWMGEYWPEEWTRQELQVMRDCPQHRFYTLTKQAQNLIKWSPFPENCWVGVTATNENMAFRGLSQFLQIETPVKYLSLEPLLWRMPQLTSYCLVQAGVSLLIIGACTGTWMDMANLCMKHTNSLCNYAGLTLTQWGNKWTAQPPISWLREIVEAADKAGAKVFLKNNLRPILSQEYGNYPPQWAFKEGELRQEIPMEPV